MGLMIFIRYSMSDQKCKSENKGSKVIKKNTPVKSLQGGAKPTDCYIQTFKPIDFIDNQLNPEISNRVLLLG